MMLMEIVSVVSPLTVVPHSEAKMNKTREVLNYKFIFIITFYLAISSEYAFSGILGTYSHNARQAFITEMDLDAGKIVSRIIFVDFNKKVVDVISEAEQLSGVAINKGGGYITYSNKKSLFIYDTTKKMVIADYDNVFGDSTWSSDNENLLAGYDIRNNKLYTIDLLENDFLAIDNPGKFFWGVSWDGNCQCFYFEVSEDEYSNHFLGEIRDGQFVETPDIKTIFKSPYGDYFVESRVSDSTDEWSELKLSKSSNTSGIGYEKIFYTNSPIKLSNLFWGASQLRILGSPRALINLETGELVRPSRTVHEEINYNKIPRSKFFDKAADESGYVLMWNRVEKNFAVEDISTGNIVEAYDKFW